MELSLNLQEIKASIKKEITNLADGCIRLGYHLKQVRDNQLYQTEGYEDIFAFAKEEFKMSEKSTYRYMQLNDQYSVDGNSMEIIPELSGFGVSKLTEMLGLSEEQRQLITTDATVQNIREVARDLKQIEEQKEILDVEKTIENTKDRTNFTPIQFFVDYYFEKDGKQIFEKVILALSTENREEKIMYAFAPSKFKNIRIKGGSVIFNAECVHIIMIAKQKQQYSYTDLANTIEQLFNVAAGGTPEEIYNRYYQQPQEEKAVAEEQIEGQDSILNHPEYLPEEKTYKQRNCGATGELCNYEAREEVAKSIGEDCSTSCCVSCGKLCGAACNYATHNQERMIEPQPNKITSLCYSCKNYVDCNEKSNTVQNCNEYINKQEAEKTAEQIYSEQQNKIDRETAKVLRDRANQEKMNDLPSDIKTEKKEIKLATAEFQPIISGLKSYLLIKNEDFKKDEEIILTEYSQGKPTERKLEAKITYMDTDTTSTAIETGYCVLNVEFKEDYEQIRS